MSMVYIGRCPKCSQIHYVCVDDGDMRNGLANDISRLIRDGYTIDHITSEDFNAEGIHECELRKKEGRRQLSLEGE
jgi:hypothetical protein